MAKIISWLRKRATARHLRTLFPPSLLSESRTAQLRFDSALKHAREAYATLRMDDSNANFVHPAWQENIRQLEKYFLDDFDMDFLGHQVINGTMAFTNVEAYCEMRPFVEGWKDAESIRKYVAGGLNKKFLESRQLAAHGINTINHLYHLVRYERFSGEQIENSLAVVEFGGGYGNMARLFLNLGKLSRFTIIDLPLFSCIQYVFLETVGGPGTAFLCPNAAEKLPAHCPVRLIPIPFIDRVPTETDLFVSTWALSESARDAYVSVRGRDWFGARGILLGYNDRWKPWDDVEIGTDLAGRFHRKAKEDIVFLPGNHYLFACGRKPR